MDQEKRYYRQLKRDVKRAGNKRRRHQLKRDLVDRPEEAHDSQEDIGRYRSADWNGLDQDARRRRAGK